MTVFEPITVAALGVASLWMLAAGSRTLIDEWRMTRRLHGFSTGEPTATPEHLRGLWLFDKLLPGASDRAEIERDLRAAGYADPQAPAIFAALRIAGALTVGLLVTTLLWLSGHWEGKTRLLAIAATGMAYVGAKLVLRALAGARSRQINDQLPFALDLMTMMLESGVSLDQCFRTLAGTEGNAAPAIKDAMTALVEDVQHGMAYGQALDRWADRLGVSGARELSGLLRQSIFHGTEVGGVLREFAREFTAKRVSRARESIGRTTTKMAVVMMLFMMPALFIVLCGPAVVTIMAALAGTRS